MNYKDQRSITEISNYAFNEGLKADKWIVDSVPNSYKSGHWDGLKSDPVLAIDQEGVYYEAVVYQGIMDGSKFCDWYTTADVEINNVIAWQPLPTPPVQVKLNS